MATSWSKYTSTSSTQIPLVNTNVIYAIVYGSNL